MNNTVSDFLNVLQKVAKEEFNALDQIDIGSVKNQNSDGTYNITLFSDEDTVIHNIPNASIRSYGAGDKVYIMKVGNQIANSFIINGSGRDQFTTMLNSCSSMVETARVELLKIINQLEISGGGTNVEANPPISGGETRLLSIRIAGVTYQIPVGTNVIANPSMSGGEDNLTSIQIGTEKYKIPQEREDMIQVVDMKGIFLDYTARTTSDSTVVEAIKQLNINKPIVLKNINKKGNYNKNIDYTTISFQTMYYFDGSKYYQELWIYNYLNNDITLSSFSDNFVGDFSAYQGTTIGQNAEWHQVVELSDRPTVSSDILTITYDTTGTGNVTGVVNSEQSLQKYTATIDVGVNNDNNIYLYGLVDGTTDYFKLSIVSGASSCSYQLISNTINTRTTINMCNFTFTTAQRTSRTDLGLSLATKLLNAPADKPIELVNFRMLETTNESTNTCYITNVKTGTAGAKVFYAEINYQHIIYTFEMTAQLTLPYLTYQLFDIRHYVNFAGKYFPKTTARNITTEITTIYNELKYICENLREYRTGTAPAYVYLPFALYNFKYRTGSTSATDSSRNQFMTARVVDDSNALYYKIIGRDNEREYTILVYINEVKLNVKYDDLDFATKTYVDNAIQTAILNVINADY